MGKLLIIVAYAYFFSFGAKAQEAKQMAFPSSNTFAIKKINKPYKVMTQGNNIIIKAEKKLHTLIAWSLSGNRLAESQQIADNIFRFNVPVFIKIIFIRIQFLDAEVYTEKLMVGL